MGVGQLMNFVPWLVKRAPGVTSVALVAHEDQPNSGEDTVPLQTMMFTLAGALRGTDVKLEVRRPDDLMVRGTLQFLPGLWTTEATQALVPHLRVFEMDYRLWDGGEALSKICALSGLEQATLGLRCEGARGLRNWAPPAPGLSSLRSLTLDSCDAPCAVAVLSATGPNLTELRSLNRELEPRLLEAVSKLSSLRRLEIQPELPFSPDVNFKGLKALTELELDLMGSDEEPLVDWTFLTTFPALRKLTLKCLDRVNASLTEALLAIPQLEDLQLLELFRWQGSAHLLGTLRARLAVERPRCRVTATDMGAGLVG